MQQAAARASSQPFQPSEAPTLRARLDQFAKRLLDAVLATAGLFCLSPLFLCIGIMLKRDSPGPIFYGGPRVGKGGRGFQILKFRTMAETPTSFVGPRITAEDDPRITRLGRWLRETKINELPQLWNVFKGEMSLVGPRPEDPEIVATWAPEIRREILSVAPGITSPASVLYRNEEALLSTKNVMQTYLQSVLPSKLRLDQLYVRHRSFGLDLDTLLWTVLVLIPILRSFVPAEDALFLGPMSRFFRRYLNWFVVDALVTFAAIAMAGFIWRLTTPLDIGIGPAIVIASGFALLFSLTGALLGMNRVEWAHAWASEASGLLASAILAGLFALVSNQVVTGVPLLPPSLIIFASLLALFGFVAARYRSRLVSGFAYRWLAHQAHAEAAQERVLIVGGGQTGQFITWLLSGGNNVGVFRVVGFADDDLYKQGTRYHGASVIGKRADIPRLVAKHDIGIIVFAIHNITEAERARVLAICHSTPARVVLVPDIVGTLHSVVSDKVHDDGAGLPVEPVAAPLITSQGISPIQAQVWLAELEKAAQSGDLALVSDQIRSIREGLEKLAI